MASERQGFRWRRWLLTTVLALFVVWLTACFLVVYEPTVNRLSRADAILVLGPSTVDGRAAEAYRLARAHYAGVVVVSTAPEENPGACHNQNPAYQVICFHPSPATTRGEAEEIGRLAAQHHWHSVIVVTSKYHVSRARMIIDRCLPGKLMVIAAPGRPSPGTWAYQFLYQTGGYARAWLHPSC